MKALPHQILAETAHRSHDTDHVRRLRDHASRFLEVATGGTLMSAGLLTASQVEGMPYAGGMLVTGLLCGATALVGYERAMISANIAHQSEPSGTCDILSETPFTAGSE